MRQRAREERGREEVEKAMVQLSGTINHPWGFRTGPRGKRRRITDRERETRQREIKGRHRGRNRQERKGERERLSE